MNSNNVGEGNKFMTPFAQAIANLGSTPESITTLLHSKGIKGYRMRASCCPIANYLKSCGFDSVTVAAYANRHEDPKEDTSAESILLPFPIRKWIADFDDGRYPEFYQD